MLSLAFHTKNPIMTAFIDKPPYGEAVRDSSPGSTQPAIGAWLPSCRWLMYNPAGENGLDLDALRARLRRMSDRELLWFGRAALYMCSPDANHGKGPRRVFVIQLREAVREWRRRRPRPKPEWKDVLQTAPGAFGTVRS
jgi:hypothetical protein